MRTFISLRSILTSLVLATAVAACGGSSSSGSTANSGGTGSSAADDPSCPVTVPGTSVDVEDTDTGAALVFVTTGDVEEVRRRVASMAQMHNDHHGKMGALPTGDEPGGGHAGHDMGDGDMKGHDMGGGDMKGHDMGGGDMKGHDMGDGDMKDKDHDMGGGDMKGHDMGDGDMKGKDHDMGGGEHAGHAGGMISIHSKATPEDVDGGARIVFVSGGADVAKLQSELRKHAQHFSSGSCAMSAD